MFKTVRDAFRIKEIRHRVFYVLLALVVIRAGSQIPVPGVDSTFFSQFFSQNANDAFAFLNAFTGGGFSNFSILALVLRSIKPRLNLSRASSLICTASCHVSNILG